MKKRDALSLLRNVIVTIVFMVFSTLVSFQSLHGAEPPASAGYELPRGTNEFGLWAGGSPDSSKIFGNTTNRQLLLVGLRYGRILAAWESLSLEYTLDILPAAVVFEPEHVRGRSAIYGAGLTPLGFKVNFLQQSWIKPFVAAAVGFLYFQDDIPVPHSSRFNFTPELGLGLQFFLTPKRAVTIGYKLHHMSNANTGESNPGMDSHVIYAGFSFFTP